MKTLIPGNRTTMILLALGGLLVLTILLQVTLQNSNDTTIDPGSTDMGIELPESVNTAFSPMPFDNYAEILERPLLFANRTMPPEPEIAVEPEKPRSPLRLKLEGVAISSDSRVALLRTTTGNQLIQLAEGASHEGWILESLGNSQATFRRGEESTDIILEVKSNNRRRR